MRWKPLVAIAVGALVAVTAAAQQQVYNITWLSADLSTSGSAFYNVFKDALRDLGYVEGRNVRIEALWGEGSSDRINSLARDLMKSKPDIIVAQGGPAALPLHRTGITTPVVFAYSGDPVEAKLADNFARPGHNFTGVSFLSLDLVGKRMELLKEVLPGVKRVAIVANPEHPGQQSELRVSQTAARSLGLEIDYFQVKDAAQLEDAFTGIAKARSEAIVVFPDAITMRYRERIAAFALKQRIPAISGWAPFAEAGNLLSYGPNLKSSFLRLATYVDRIIKGTKPAEIPIEFPTSIELVVNQNTARALGVTIPRSVLIRADRVIE